MPAKPPVIIAYPGLKIISHEAAIITPPAKVAFMIVSISSLPVFDLLINAAVSADAVIEKNVLMAARYCATPTDNAELKLGQYMNRNKVPIIAISLLL